MSRTSGSIVGKDLAANATTGIFTVQQALTKKAAGNWPASSSWGQYEISRSLRFNSADSAYLSRTPASAGNRKTWTWSGWVKRSKLGSTESVFGAYLNNDNRLYIHFNPDNIIKFFGKTSAVTDIDVSASAVFRDLSAWYHFVCVIDTTQATGSNRVKIYVNNVQQTLTFTTTPSQNADLYINTAQPHRIGDLDGSVYFNGYMTEIHFVDGQALTPSDFGETDGTTGVWKPKAYTGTYGTNGFFLNFSDNSNTTSATLGKDQAGSNDWTPNNFSVTAGAGNDSLVDTPTPYSDDTGVGGEVRGNYCTLNPLSTIGETLSNGNLYQVGSTALARGSRGTIAVSSGKWYYEFNATVTTNTWGVGWIGVTSSYNGGGVSGIGVIFYDNGNKQINGSTSAYGSSWSTEVIGVALDLDSLEATFYINGVSQGTITGITADNYYPGGVTNASNDAGFFNFGQRPFAYTAPSGFKALCTQNLPTPTVVQGDDYFNTVLYTGNGSTQSITGVGFQPDFIWFKRRDAVAAPALNDAVRGATKSLTSYSTEAEYTSATGDDLVSFDSDGFSVGPTDIWSSYNVSGGSIVAWNWNAGGSNATNTDGTITSTVRANPTAGISIVSYTGVGPGSVANEIEVGHGLGAIPKMVIVKVRSTTGNWFVFTTVIDGSNDFLYLNTTDAAGNSGNTPPTSDVFYAGGALNYSGETYIAYCFAEIPGFSKFGSYTGNGSADGPFTYTGFRPAFVIIKRTDTTGEWVVFDNKRDGYNVNNDQLYPNSNVAEEDGQTYSFIDLISNGFKCRNTALDKNASGGTYIYMAFAENPFKYSLAR